MSAEPRSLFRHVAAFTVMALVALACAPETSARIGGETRWIDVAKGRLKTQVFVSASVNDRPVLVLVLHGDIPDPAPDYQYRFAKALTREFPEASERSASLRASLGDDWDDKDVVAAGILRPGYADPSGDRSSGEMGMAYGDNYTPAVVDAVATVARHLEAAYNARAVVLVGHSGGGAIVANVLGRHPGLADAALLVACVCDPEAWRARMQMERPGPIWDRPNPSLIPLSLTSSVAPDTRVRLIVGTEDDVALPADSRKYAEALQTRGIDASLTVVPGLGHNILITPESFRELGELVRVLGRGGSPSTQASEGR